MGQKVNPHGLRVGVIKDWDSRWYARPDKVGDLIEKTEDEMMKVRNLGKKSLDEVIAKLAQFGLSLRQEDE